jgi:transcriptional regulator with XRE-family HTH domain
VRKPFPTKPIDQKVQRRLDALERLIDTEYDRSAKVFEDRTGIKMTQVSQWFTGYRALRENALRRLEDATGKPPGFFDGELSPQASPGYWPFATIPIERFIALPQKQQGWIEGKLDSLIEQCEAQISPADEAVLRRLAATQQRAKPDKENS